MFLIEISAFFFILFEKKINLFNIEWIRIEKFQNLAIFVTIYAIFCNKNFIFCSLIKLMTTHLFIFFQKLQIYSFKYHFYWNSNLFSSLFVWKNYFLIEFKSKTQLILIFYYIFRNKNMYINESNSKKLAYFGLIKKKVRFWLEKKFYLVEFI